MFLPVCSEGANMSLAIHGYLCPINIKAIGFGNLAVELVKWLRSNLNTCAPTGDLHKIYASHLFAYHLFVHIHQ